MRNYGTYLNFCSFFDKSNFGKTSTIYSRSYCSILQHERSGGSIPSLSAQRPYQNSSKACKSLIRRLFCFQDRLIMVQIDAKNRELSVSTSMVKKSTHGNLCKALIMNLFNG
jgi:hypothetical protein